MLQEPKAKLPDVLVEHNSVMRGAIPCLPVPLAWFCLVWNFLLPGTGTINLNIDTTTEGEAFRWKANIEFPNLQVVYLLVVKSVFHPLSDNLIEFA